MIAYHGGGAVRLWVMHVTDRLNGRNGPGPFASEPWWEYVPTVLAQALPWTPLALAGSLRSLGRAFSRRSGDRMIQLQLPAMIVAGDRLLWVWAVAPLALLALASVKNAHYAIAAQIPWSIWTALALARLAVSLRHRDLSRSKLRFAACAGFASLALLYGMCLWLVAPWFDRRGVEWAFYESVSRQVPPATSIALLYDEWDRLPYEGPFGSVPHDLAVRLFYLGRPACWHNGIESLLGHDQSCERCLQSRLRPVQATDAAVPLHSAFGIIGRRRDLPALEQFGNVEIIASGPNIRADRTYDLFRFSPDGHNGRLSHQMNPRAAY
jgi:hypothetical protein